MRRLACLLLFLTPALAWASGGVAEADRGACVSTASAAHGPAPDPLTAPPAHSPAHRPAGAASGGGEDSELLQPRGRMPKWHSFLPGMFR
ncbi:MAG TPA: hypothetical protein VGC74_15655 [Stenotrophomonas sp.]|jgi:hypothetical protein